MDGFFVLCDGDLLYFKYVIFTIILFVSFFFSSRRRHTRCYRDWSSDVCSSDLCAHLPQRLEKQAARHRYVEQHQIGGRGLERADQRRGLDLFTRNRHPRDRLHDTAESLTDDRMVVRDEDANLRDRSGHDAATGIVTAMPVPWPGSPRIIRVPPQANARSRMPTNPRDRSPVSDWGVNPTPLSSTPRMMTAPARRTDTSTRVALECRATLVSASWMIRKAWLAISSGSRGKSSAWRVTAMPVRWAVSRTKNSMAASRPR